MENLKLQEKLNILANRIDYEWSNFRKSIRLQYAKCKDCFEFLDKYCYKYEIKEQIYEWLVTILFESDNVNTNVVDNLLNHDYIIEDMYDILISNDYNNNNNNNNYFENVLNIICGKECY